MNIKVLFACVLLAVLSSLSLAEKTPDKLPVISPEKRAEIDKMLQLTGMEAITNQIKLQAIASLKKQVKDMTPEFWESVTKKIKTTGMSEKMVYVYDKYYSLEDLKAVNAFYATPAGQRLLISLPKIMQESVNIGEAWGGEVTKQVLDEAKAERAKNKP